MTESAQSAVTGQRLLAIGALGFCPAFPLESADTYGSAQSIETKQRRDAMLRLGLDKADLTHRAAKARNLRQSKKASLIEAELRAVIRQILAIGLAQPEAQ